MAIASRCNERRNDIAISITYGDHFVSFGVLRPLCPKLSPPFFAAVVVPSP